MKIEEVTFNTAIFLLGISSGCNVPVKTKQTHSSAANTIWHIIDNG